MSSASAEDIDLFIGYAGQNIERWQAMIGQTVTHARLGTGTIDNVTLGGSNTAVLHITFPSQTRSSRFQAAQLADPSIFTQVPTPLTPEHLADLRRDAASAAEQAAAKEAERQRRAAASRQASAIHQPTAPARHGVYPRPPVPSEALRDVLSVPVGKTEAFVKRYETHACPDHYHYRPTQYITFRGQGGTMWRVYDLGRAHIFLLNPDAPETLREAIIGSQPIDEAAKERVRGYWAERYLAGEFDNTDNDDFRFYVLPPGGQIELPHHPYPEGTIQGHTYFDLGELQSGRKVVRILSRKTH